MDKQLETQGFLRIEQVLSLLPIKKSCWFAGIKAGRFPKPVKFGKLSFYRRRDIEELLARIAAGAEGSYKG